MELQNKFEKIIVDNINSEYCIFYIKAAKDCAKLCLEEQIKLLARLGGNIKITTFNIFEELNVIQQQLKELEDETK